MAINSDAHIFSSVGDVTRALEIVRGAGIVAEQILNLTTEKVENFLSWHRQHYKISQEKKA